ncbi:MAG: CARDB domain-containing protein, partial [Chloroflexota bacterium]
EAYARSVRSSDDGTSATLTVLMRNNGNTRVNEPITVTFYRDAALTEVVGQTTVPAPDADFTGMTGCAVRGLEVEVQANWQEELNTGDYFFWAKVDSSSSITEVREDDNVIIGKLKILPVGAFVPLVTR